MENIKNDRAFTLVELMVAMSLLAFLGLLSATTFDTGGWLAHYRLKGAARELYMTMQKARMNAIKENREWAVVFDTGTPNRYYLRSSPGPDKRWGTSDDVHFQTVNLFSYKNGIGYGHGSASLDATGDTSFPSDNVSFNSILSRIATNTVVFSPNGSSLVKGYCYLSNDAGDTYAVGVPTLATIQVKKWDKALWK